MTTKQETVILSYSLPDFIYKIDEHRQAGWEFHKDHEPGVFGFTYECHMIRNATDDQLEKDQTEANKPSRAEILAKARAAKAAKKEGN